MPDLREELSATGSPSGDAPRDVENNGGDQNGGDRNGGGPFRGRMLHPRSGGIHWIYCQIAALICLACLFVLPIILVLREELRQRGNSTYTEVLRPCNNATQPLVCGRGVSGLVFLLYIMASFLAIRCIVPCLDGGNEPPVASAPEGEAVRLQVEGTGGGEPPETELEDAFEEPGSSKQK